MDSEDEASVGLLGASTDMENGGFEKPSTFVSTAEGTVKFGSFASGVFSLGDSALDLTNVSILAA